VVHERKSRNPKQGFKSRHETKCLVYSNASSDISALRSKVYIKSNYALQKLNLIGRTVRQRSISNAAMLAEV